MRKRRKWSRWIRRHARKLAGLYLLVLVCSHLIQSLFPAGGSGLGPSQSSLNLDGQRLAYREWGGTDLRKAPLILLHGSPSRGSGELEALGRELASGGRRVIALDRWGYGASERWVDDYSFAADGDAVLGLMDQLNIQTAHLGGWSYGGAPAIELAVAQPGRVRSVVLLASIGDQVGEGSGNYYIEHTKYGGLFLLAMGVPELLPHFGLLGRRSVRYAFVRDFWDADQRRTSRQLREMKAPTLIVHGKDDPLVPAWLAAYHHSLLPQSRLVMLDASHFFPMTPDSEGFGIAIAEVGEFLERADEGRAGELAGLRNETTRANFRALWDGGPSWRGPKNWWVLLVIGASLGFFLPRMAAACAGLAGGLLIVDLVGGLGCVLLGAVMRQRRPGRLKTVGVVVLWGIGLSLVSALLLPLC